MSENKRRKSGTLLDTVDTDKSPGVLHYSNRIIVYVMSHRGCNNHVITIVTGELVHHQPHP